MSKPRLTHLPGADPLWKQDLRLVNTIGGDRPRPLEEADAFVEAARDGDRRAAASLLTALLPRVRNLVRYLVRGDADTDDIAQEALLAILRGLAGYRADGSLKSWVDRVVVRATFAFLRKRGREPSHDSAGAAFIADAEMAQVALPDEFLSRRRAIAVLDQLSPDQRHAVVLHHVLEMSVPEIAGQLEISAETVRSRLRLARTRLRAKGLRLAQASGERIGMSFSNGSNQNLDTNEADVNMEPEMGMDHAGGAER